MSKAYNGYLNFTTDTWTSLNGRALVALNVHFEENGVAVALLLDIVELAQSHSGANLMHVLITENRDCGLHTTVLALDIAQFFPSMSHEVICALLTKLGFNGKIVCFLAAFLQDHSTTYTWDSIATNTHFQCSDGIPQGDLLSPVLSALYLSLVIKHLFPWNYKRWVNSLFFVDDSTLVCSSPSLEDNVATLSIFYKHFLCLLTNIGLTVEQSKLERKHFIAYSPKGSHHSFADIQQLPLHYMWGGKAYEVQPSKIWRYLGFFFDSFLCFDFHVQYYTNKGFSTIRACNMLRGSCGRLGPKQRVICYNAYIVSVLTYGLPLWYTENGAGVLKNFRKMARVKITLSAGSQAAFGACPSVPWNCCREYPPFGFGATS